ncbi:MAG: PQQ-binding-like beta-propeller repeat protein, partial [Pirellulaceae bacterium]|nr:PQQ-binding-like beta-propeller repeat protein [Pirellulaceae bacterium]
MLRHILACCFAALCTGTLPCPADDPTPLTVAVMDPLAMPLSCPCVKGHAQRRYDQLAAFLQGRLHRKVNVLFAEELSKILRGQSGHDVHLIIGKRSVVQSDARINGLPVRPVMMLTGKDGKTTLTGLFTVRKDDPAQTLEDLKGYTVLFGPPECDEKFRAAAEALGKAGVQLPKKFETRPGCSDSVTEMLENAQRPTAAVISSYAAALLEGCGTIEKGSIRVIGQTQPVPFVTVFFTAAVEEPLGAQIREALSAVKQRPDLLIALETGLGFVPLEEPTQSAARAGTGEQDVAFKREVTTADEGAWPGWRGHNRDGVVARLPARLPQQPKVLWSMPLTGRGLAGVAATERCVIVADRDATDTGDVFRCLDARTGQAMWTLEYATSGRIKDYGNSPRATPLIDQGKVYVLGGLGDLHCLTLADGKAVWSKHLARDFGAAVPTWGYCSSPLAVDGKLIVNPGAKSASLVALDLASGKEVWRCPGLPAAYASFIVGTFGGVRQIVGYDQKSLGGWEPATGKRLWTLVPPASGDFNVPTPIDAGGKLVLASENNGTRTYDFERGGSILVKPIATNEDLSPDSSTPVLAGGRLFGCWYSLHCLQADSTLKTLWTGDDDAFGNYASLIASPERVLIVSNRGELLLVDATAEEF